MGYPNHTGFQSHGAISVPVRPPILSFLVVVVGLCVPCLMVISTSLFSTVLVGRLAKNCAKCILATTKIGPFSVAQLHTGNFNQTSFHTTIHSRPVASGGARAPPLFGRSVNLISTRGGGTLSPPSTMCPPRFSDLATAH